MILILFCALAVVSLVLFYISLGLWTYNDAKARGLNAPLWTLLVVLSQDLIALLIYIFAGRKSIRGKCKKCDTIVSDKEKYCSNCGEAIVMEDTKKLDFSKSKKYLKFVFASICLIIFSIVGIFVGVFTTDNLPLNSHWSVGMLTSTWGDKWNVKYRASGETLEETLLIKDGGATTLYFKGTCEKGEATFYLIQGEKVLAYDISEQSDEIEVDLSQFENGTVTMLISNKNAKNLEFKSHWE